MAQRHGRNTAAWKALVKHCRTHLPWVCHLCEAPISEVPYPDAWCWTLDHIIPLAEAPDMGECLHNVKPAHLICNLRKGKNSNSDKPKLSRRWQ